METLLFIIAASVVFGIVSSHQKRKNDMRLMAKILADREGREERWKEAAELDDARRTDDFDIRERGGRGGPKIVAWIGRSYVERKFCED